MSFLCLIFTLTWYNYVIICFIVTKKVIRNFWFLTLFLVILPLRKLRILSFLGCYISTTTGQISLKKIKLILYIVDNKTAREENIWTNHWFLRLVRTLPFVELAKMVLFSWFLACRSSKTIQHNDLIFCMWPYINASNTYMQYF